MPQINVDSCCIDFQLLFKKYTKSLYCNIRQAFTEIMMSGNALLFLIHPKTS